MNAPRTADRETRWGWGTWLLLGACGAAAAAMIVIILLSLLVPRAIDRAVAAYTSSAPLELPEVSSNSAEREAIEGRIETFGSDLEEGRAEGPLILTEDELNKLVAEAVEDEAIEGLYVDLRPGGVRARVSIPLRGTLPLGPWSRDLSGRYLNGTASFEVALRGEGLDLRLTGFDVNGRALPEYALRVLREELAKQRLFEEPEIEDALQRVESIEIDDERVVIHPKR